MVRYLWVIVICALLGGCGADPDEQRPVTTAVSAAGAPTGLPNGVFHGARKRSFTPRVR